MRVTSLVLILGVFSVFAGGRKFGKSSAKRLSKIKLSEEDSLIKNLLARYRRRGKYGRPVMKYNDTVKIHFNMQLIQIMDLDEKNQILTINVWDRYNWTDVYLQWDPKDWGGVDSVRIPSKKLWTPDIKLYNYADPRLEEHREALCVVDHSGLIVWIPQAVYKSSCYIDVATFPFDIQTCHLKFGSWTYDGTKVDLEVLANATEIDLSEYVTSNSWTIIKHPAIRNNKTYTCCPEPYVDLTFTLVFQRRSTFYNYILILPCILLTSLTLVLFWIPPESPAKLMLGINIFVAFFLLLLLMESNLPPAAVSVPLLGTYYCLNMILITLSSFLNAFVVNLSFYGARRPVPMCLRKVLFNFFAKILCMDNLVKPFLETNHTTRLLAEGTRFFGINGDQKWKKDSSDLLVQMKRSPSDEQSGQLALINYHLTELMDFVKSYKERIAERDIKDKLAKEWKAIGLIFDRIFFIIYVTTIIVSMAVLLPIIAFNKYQGPIK